MIELELVSFFSCYRDNRVRFVIDLHNFRDFECVFATEFREMCK